MDIKDFISETLQQVDHALKDASQATGKEYSVYSSTSNTIKFSLAVTDTQGAESTSNKSGKAGIKIVSADIGKTQTDTIKSELVSRIEFSIHVPDE